MAMLDCSLVQIDEGVPTTGFQTNAHTIYCVVEGSGRTTVGKSELSWKPRDIIAVPPRNVVKHQALAGQANLFAVSDRDLISRLGLLKEAYART